jgi:universal stress protein E
LTSIKVRCQLCEQITALSRDRTGGRSAAAWSGVAVAPHLRDLTCLGAQVMKEILVAADLSPSSERALGRAVILAVDSRARLTALHVIGDWLPDDIAEALQTRAEQSLRAQLAANPSAASVEIGVEIVRGDPFAEILTQAWRRRAELIVMGMHRKAPFLDLFRGTTVERVLRRGDLPVLVASSEPSRPYRRVLVAVDLSVSSRRALEFALRLVPDGEFHVVHAYDVPFAGFLTAPGSHEQVATEHAKQLAKMVDEEVRTFLGQFPELRTRCHLLLERGETAEVLARAIGQVRPDLIALGTHGRTGIARAMVGSVAGEILANPPCDVVAVKGW